MITVRIQPKGPVVARDGRPFGKSSGNRMYSHAWPYPSMVAGSLRTLIGKITAPQRSFPFSNPDLLARLKSTAMIGPFPFNSKDQKIYFPAARDVVFFEEDGQKCAMPLRPQALRDGEGCDLPHKELWPLLVTRDIKPSSAPAYWSSDRMCDWLADDLWQMDSDTGTLPPFTKDSRVHVTIDPQLGSAQDGELFITEGIAFPNDVEMIAGLKGELVELFMANVPRGSNAEFLHPLGGERRLSAYSFAASDDWGLSERLCDALHEASGLRMVLTTPAIFQGGWLPGWLDKDSLTGEPPNGQGLRIRLRGATVGRWQVISGWDLERGREKPTRRLVPAGSVYFFEVVSGNPAAFVKDLWLRSVCDDAQDARDGFGGALWGVWRCSSLKEGSRGIGR